MKGKGIIIFIISMFVALACVLTFAFIAIINKQKFPIHARTYVKEKKTGLVTVADKYGRVICTFYDSVGGIGCKYSDTACLSK